MEFARRLLRRKQDSQPLSEEPIDSPFLHRIIVPDEIIEALAKDDNKPLDGLVRQVLQTQHIDEALSVFRGIAHTKPNITERLVTKYGTDRFVGYSSVTLPQEDKNLIPFRNRGETDALTADTYCVPDLSWSLNFSKLRIPQSLNAFRESKLDPFLLVYKKSAVHTERTPNNQGGEMWRGRFLTDPKEALAAVIHFIPPKQ